MEGRRPAVGLGQHTGWAVAASGLGAATFGGPEEGGSGGGTPRGSGRWRTAGWRAAAHVRGACAEVGGGDEVLGMRAGVGG